MSCRVQRGTLGYMAPELMGYKHEESPSNRHPVTMVRRRLCFARPDVLFLCVLYLQPTSSLLDHSETLCIIQAVDIYSFGLLLWAIITGKQPCMHDESLRKPR
jgi:serine/threonine protein kinase